MQIAHVSMYLMEHALHEETNALLGLAIPVLPLGRGDHIRCANALTTSWNEVLAATECAYVCGNPPYAGSTTTSAEQKQWLRSCYPLKYKVALADFCTAWFVKAADYMRGNPKIRTAFVATNSICQGQQVETLWGLLIERGAQLHFAWPSFQWRNEAAGNAGVTVIIVGFALQPPKTARLLRLNAAGQMEAEEAAALTPYLSLGKTPGVIVHRHSEALSAPLEMVRGSQPADGGHLILEFEEGERLLEEYPELEPFVKRYVGSAELMGSRWRYCLWLTEEGRGEWERYPKITRRVEACRAWRERQVKSGDAWKLRERPWSFREQKAQPEALVVPNVTSENRLYKPMAFVDENYIVSNLAFMIPGADECHFAVLTSRMHQCWIRLTAGRLESRYRYSRDLVYNTFIWPEIPEAQHQELWDLGNTLLMRREHYYVAGRDLGELYSDLPADLRGMHRAIDEHVERLYRPQPFADDEERTAFLLELYAKAVAEQEQRQGQRRR